MPARSIFSMYCSSVRPLPVALLDPYLVAEVFIGRGAPSAMISGVYMLTTMSTAPNPNLDIGGIERIGVCRHGCAQIRGSDDDQCCALMALFLYDLGVLEEQPLVRPWRPFDAILNSIGVDFVVERGVGHVSLLSFRISRDQRAALILVALAALLLCELMHLGVDPVNPAGAVVQAADDLVRVHD